ncbi:Uncharacterised protein [Candidatus Venteria ishoeyi]|uniref:Uncharacterized protein n=1 Tax=Candidatus Venteria ishoeyi TaxID=1899563 RepID=A0A1H6FE53_9GAMM|nr:Uncharacterised protein [Candidatus Venteria ishoeyi]SEH08217.1 Uncharacterised protein [Candidatus Venteria ishoeyi]
MTAGYKRKIAFRTLPKDLTGFKNLSGLPFRQNKLSDPASSGWLFTPFVALIAQIVLSPLVTAKRRAFPAMQDRQDVPQLTD